MVSCTQRTQSNNLISSKFTTPTASIGTANKLNNTNSNKLHYISSFKCMVGDSFGKIISRPSKVYRLYLDEDDYDFCKYN